MDEPLFLYDILLGMEDQLAIVNDDEPNESLIEVDLSTQTKKVDDQKLDVQNDDKEEFIFKPVTKECQLCTESKCIEDTFDMLMCTHSCCNDCAKTYYTTQITDRTIYDLVCPFCNQPDLRKQEGTDSVHEYFAMMDITLRSIISDQKIHDLFQTKLRDLTLVKDKRFVWCSCSYGYYVENNAAACPRCLLISNSTPVKSNTELYRNLGKPSTLNDITNYFELNMITCPECKFTFSVDRGGCIHFVCLLCKHEFCSQCMKKYYRKRECQLLPSCENMGLHAHHTRVCTYYLRELEIVDLKRLLDTNKVSYEQTNPYLFSSKCRIQISKLKCNNDVHANCAGVCRDHYVEYLCDKIRKKKLDCIQILNIEELEKVLKRSNITLPFRSSLSNYRGDLINLIKNNLPIYF